MATNDGQWTVVRRRAAFEDALDGPLLTASSIVSSHGPEAMSAAVLSSPLLYLFCTYTVVFERFWRIRRFRSLNVLGDPRSANVRIPPSAPTSTLA